MTTLMSFSQEVGAGVVYSRADSLARRSEKEDALEGTSTFWLVSNYT